MTPWGQHKRPGSKVDGEKALGRARALRDQGQPENALEWCEKAMAALPEQADVFILAGEVLSDLGQDEQAEACLEQAIGLAPGSPGPLLAMGRALDAQGRLARAADLYRRALAAAEADAQNRYPSEKCRALNRLGAALYRMGNQEGAMGCFQQVLAMAPENPTACHFAAALGGKSPRAAPQAYIKTLFNAFSARFDRVLTGSLAYRTPGQLRRLLDAHGKGAPYDRAVDLGCGTGLSGEAFRDAARHLTGIDLSIKMVQKAMAKGIYDDLAEGDICEVLAAQNRCYDLFIAADVLVYIGDLQPIFTACRNCAAAGACMVFSTEHGSRSPYRLLATGRFAHHDDHVRDVARACGWRVVADDRAPIRKEDEAWILGDLFLITTATDTRTSYHEV